MNRRTMLPWWLVWVGEEDRKRNRKLLWACVREPRRCTAQHPTCTFCLQRGAGKQAVNSAKEASYQAPGLLTVQPEFMTMNMLKD